MVTTRIVSTNVVFRHNAHERNYTMCTDLLALSQTVLERLKKGVRKKTPCLLHEKGAMTQSDVVFVAMDAVVRIYEEDLVATRSVIAMKYPYALDLSWLHQLTAS